MMGATLPGFAAIVGGLLSIGLALLFVGALWLFSNSTRAVHRPAIAV